MSTSMLSFVFYIRFRFSTQAHENHQMALIIIQPIWNIQFSEIALYCRRCHFFDKMWTNDIFDVDTPTVVSKSSYCRYPSNEKIVAAT